MFAAVGQNPSDYPWWKIVHGRLYSYRPNHAVEDLLEDEDAWKLVLPVEQREEAMQECHAEPTAGHLGRAKTHARVTLYYYWPSLRKDVADFVRNCLICQQCKVQQTAPAGLMGSHRASRPWQVVAGDIMRPFPKSARGHEYLLIFLDLFTKWIEWMPIRKANARTIEKELEQRIFLRFGVPEAFHSDNGTEFKNRALDSFLNKCGVTHTTIPPYHAQANPVERVNRTVKTMITAFLEENHKDWDLHIPELMFAYNTATQESTGSSPAFLNMGRQPTPPVFLKRREERAAEELAEAAELERWRTRLQKLQDVQQSAAKNASAAQQRQSHYYNASRRDVRFELKDKVWNRNRILSCAVQGVAAKLTPKYAGPYVISAKLGSNVYELQDLDGKDCGKVHVEDLKLYQGKVALTAEAGSPTDVNSARDDQAGEDTGYDGFPNNLASEHQSAPRKRGRPRKARLVVTRTTRVIGAQASRRSRVTADADERQPLPLATNASATPPRSRGRPTGSRNAATTNRVATSSLRRMRATARRARPDSLIS